MLQKSKIHFMGSDTPIWAEAESFTELAEKLQRTVKSASHEISSIEFDFHVRSISDLRVLAVFFDQFSQDEDFTKYLDEKTLHS